MRIGRADRLHVGRQRVPDRRARGRRAGARAVPHVRGRVRTRRCEGLGVGRVIARPFVGAPGAFTRTANRHDYAMPPPATTLLDRLTAAGDPGRRDRQDQGPVRGPRHHPRVPTPVDDARAGCRRRGDAGRAARGLIFANLVDFDTQYGHRNDVAGLRRQPRALRRRLAELLPRLRADRPAGHHRRSRQRPDHAEHRSLARVRAAAGDRRRRARRAPISARVRTFADLGQTLADVFGVGPCRTAPASSAAASVADV